MLEVEVKGRVKDQQQLKRIHDFVSGWEPLPVEDHEDIYFSHPDRDFARTDEALRLRQLGDDYRLTYKGPKLDSRTKTREEIDLPVPAGIREILERLGFREVSRVRKRRTPYRKDNLILCIDQVEGLGWFVEMELQGGEAREAPDLLKMLASLGMESETRSYLELAMES